MIYNYGQWFNISERKKQLRDLGNVETEITIEIDLEASYHADERKFRHDTEITDKEIIKTFEKAIPHISEGLMTNIIDVGDIFRVFDKSNNLNVIGVLEGSKMPLKYIVVTVMRKQNFKPFKGQHSFYVY